MPIHSSKSSAPSSPHGSRPEVEAFLAQLEALVDDPCTPLAHVVQLAYSLDNPILDPTWFVDRGAVTRAVLADPAYATMRALLRRKEHGGAAIQATSQLQLCATCGELHGSFEDPRASGVVREQRCACTTDDEHREPSPRWEGYDFACAFELCHACAAAVVESGSKWSKLFCATCDREVRVWNERGRRIPLGRHSFANDLFLTGPARSHDEGSEARSPADRSAADRSPSEQAFDAALRALFERLDRLRAWRAARVAALHEWAGQPSSLDAYLEAVASEPLRREAVVALAEAFR